MAQRRARPRLRPLSNRRAGPALQNSHCLLSRQPCNYNTSLVKGTALGAKGGEGLPVMRCSGRTGTAGSKYLPSVSSLPVRGS